MNLVIYFRAIRFQAYENNFHELSAEIALCYSFGPRTGKTAFV